MGRATSRQSDTRSTCTWIWRVTILAFRSRTFFPPRHAKYFPAPRRSREDTCTPTTNRASESISTKSWPQSSRTKEQAAAGETTEGWTGRSYGHSHGLLQNLAHLPGNDMGLASSTKGNLLLAAPSGIDPGLRAEHRRERQSGIHFHVWIGKLLLSAP